MISNDVISSAEEQALATGKISRLFVKFAVPSVIGLLFLGVQSIIDGVMLGRFVGASALASVNLILPCYSFMVALAIVVGVGCQTLVCISLGRGDRQEANHAFTTGFIFLSSFSAVASVLIWVFAGELAGFLGANEALKMGAVAYIRALVPFFALLSTMFLCDYILKSTGHPLFAMLVMASTVVINTGLDVLFVGIFGWGITGAGISTGIAFTVGAMCNIGLLTRRKNILALQAGRFKLPLVWKMFYNGSSEGISELSAGITVFMFNLAMMKYLGENGVAAFSATNYLLFIGTTIFLGISDGIIPIMSYNFGAGRYDRLKATLRLAVKTNLLIGFGLFLVLSIGGEKFIALFFRSGDIEVVKIAAYGTSIFALAFLFNGLNILASSYFTSMGNAKVSVIISMLRGLVFVAAGILIFPAWFGIDGIWFDIPVAELLTFVVSFLLVRKSLRVLVN